MKDIDYEKWVQSDDAKAYNDGLDYDLSAEETNTLSKLVYEAGVREGLRRAAAKD